MRPSEMKNSALVAAAKAERDGFLATAEALLLLAQDCAWEARELEASIDLIEYYDRGGPAPGSGSRAMVAH